MKLITIAKESSKKPITGIKYEFSTMDAVVIPELHKAQVLYALNQITDGNENLESFYYVQDYAINDEPNSDFIALLSWTSQPNNDPAYYLDTKCLVGCSGTCSFVIDESGIMRIKLEQPYVTNLSCIKL